MDCVFLKLAVWHSATFLGPPSLWWKTWTKWPAGLIFQCNGCVHMSPTPKNHWWITKSLLCAPIACCSKIISSPKLCSQSWSRWASQTCRTGCKPGAGAGLLVMGASWKQTGWPGNKVVNTNDITKPHPPRLGRTAFWSCVQKGPQCCKRVEN